MKKRIMKNKNREIQGNPGDHLKIENTLEKEDIKKQAKKRVKKFRLGISVKIGGGLATVLILVFAALMVYISGTSNAKVTADRISYDKANNALYASQITAIVDRVDQANTQAVLEIEKILSLPADQRKVEDLVRIQAAILESSPDFLSGTIAFEPNAFDGKDSERANAPYRDEDGRVILYTYKDASRKLQSEMLEKSAYEGEDVAAEWYTQVKDSNIKHLTNPYEFDGNMMVSISMPMTYQGKFIGVIATDLNFANVKEILVNLSTENYNYNLADIDGNLIVLGGTNLFAARGDASSGATKVGASDATSEPTTSEATADTSSGATTSSESSQDIEGNLLDITPEAVEIINNAQKTQAGILAQDKSMVENDGSASIDIINAYTGVRERLTSVPVEFEGYQERWIFVSAVNYDYFIQDAKTMVNNMIIISIISLVALLLIIVFLIEFGIAKIVQRVESSLDSISNFDLSSNIQNDKMQAIMKRNDEMGNIYRSLSNMTGNLRSTIETILESFHALSGTVGEMSDTATNSANSATEINKAVEGIAQGASA